MPIIEKINLNDSSSEASRKIFDNDTRLSKEISEVENKVDELSADTIAAIGEISGDLAQIRRDQDIFKANVFDKDSIRFGKLVNSTDKNIVNSSANVTTAVTDFILVPDWATMIYVFTHEGDLLPANILARFSNEANDTGNAELLSLSNAETTGKTIPKGYKYVAVTVVRNSTSGFEPDLNNIFVGFSENYKTHELAKDIIPATVIPKDDDLRFLSLDFHCFEVYKTDRSDKIYSTFKASDIYKAILKLKLFGFDKSKIYKMSMFRRNYGANMDYSIIIGVWTGNEWIRDTYFISTGVNFEASNPNGINEVIISSGSKLLIATIDYSMLPASGTFWVDRTEDGEPNHIIKKECFIDPVFSFSNKEKYIRSGSGSMLDSATYNCSDYIPIAQGENIILSGYDSAGNDNSCLCAFYDSDKKYISEYTTGVRGTKNRLILKPSDYPANASYIAGTERVVDKNGYIFLSGSAIAQELNRLDNKIEVLEQKIEDNTGELVVFCSKLNTIFHRTAAIFQSSGSYNCSDFVPVFSDKDLIVSGYDSADNDNSCFLAFFDRNKKFISYYTTGVRGDKNKLIVPASVFPTDAAFAIVTERITAKNGAIEINATDLIISDAVTAETVATHTTDIDKLKYVGCTRKGYIVHRIYGIYQASASFNTSELVPCTNSDTITVSGYDANNTNNSCLAAFFDKDKNYISHYTTGVAGVVNDHVIDKKKIPSATAFITVTERTIDGNGKVSIVTTDLFKEVATLGSNLDKLYIPGQIRPNQSCISFIADDGMRAGNWYLNILDEFAYKSAFSIVIERMHGQAGSAYADAYTRDEVVELLINRGHEIISHCIRGTIPEGLTNLSDEALDRELGVSKLFLQGLYSMLPVDGFVSPQGYRNARVDSFVAKYYKANYITRPYTTENVINTFPLPNPYYVKRASFDIKANDISNIDAMKGLVDKVKNNPGWLIFTTHPHYTEFFDSNTIDRKGEFRQLLQYIKDSNIPVVLPSLAHQYFSDETKNVIYSEPVEYTATNLPVKIHNHRYGAAMTYTEQTDTISYASRYAVEYYAHKNNARVGAFINYNDKISDIAESQTYGACKFDVYFPTDEWVNPSTGVREIIPDYNSTTWTQAGINQFGYVEGGITKINGVAVSVGSAKTAKTPNHGLQMYAYSKGKYGWNSDGTMGKSKAYELTKLSEQINTWYYGLFKKYPSAISYRNGRVDAANQLTGYYLQARNSSSGVWNDTDNAPTWYDQRLGVPAQDVTKDLLISRPSTTRFWDWVNSSPNITKQQTLDSVSSIATLTSNNNGWQNNFTHWHSMYKATDPDMKLKVYDEYFPMIKQSANARIHFCSYGEAAEYMLFRTCITKVTAKTNKNRVSVQVTIADPLSIPVGRINTPISIEVDFTGTYLQGKNVKSTTGKIIRLSSYQVIVEVPFPTNKNTGTIDLELYDSGAADYMTLGTPVISKVSYANGVLTFKTDVPCYSTLFRKTDDNTIGLVSRQIDSYKTDHSIEIADITNVAIGVISETGQTNLMEVKI